MALSLTDGFPSLLSCQDPCGLYCGSGRRWRKADNVDDGTRCSRYGLDVCIQDRCQVERVMHGGFHRSQLNEKPVALPPGEKFIGNLPHCPIISFHFPYCDDYSDMIIHP